MPDLCSRVGDARVVKGDVPLLLRDLKAEGVLAVSSSTLASEAPSRCGSPGRSDAAMLAVREPIRS
jgi:hypothetical protein